MSLKYTTGGRTRNVVNIAVPGGTTAAHVVSDFAAIAAPTGASAGFKNFHSQKNLHIVVKNNGLDDAGSTPVAVVVTVYGYNTSLGGEWAPLTIPVSVGNNNALEFKNVVTSVAKDANFRAIIPIEGVERIAVATSFTGGTPDEGDYSIWLGVNSI
jgi:archaellum component FlaG (FlaF/FlaG flagellin family)